LALLSRSALAMDALAAIFLAWPETWGEEDSIAALMQDPAAPDARDVWPSAVSDSRHIEL